MSQRVTAGVHMHCCVLKHKLRVFDSCSTDTGITVFQRASTYTLHTLGISQKTRHSMAFHRTDSWMVNHCLVRSFHIPASCFLALLEDLKSGKGSRNNTFPEVASHFLVLARHKVCAIQLLHGCLPGWLRSSTWTSHSILLVHHNHSLSTYAVSTHPLSAGI
jgi:hypothetical protein